MLFVLAMSNQEKEINKKEFNHVSYIWCGVCVCSYCSLCQGSSRVVIVRSYYLLLIMIV